MQSLRNRRFKRWLAGSLAVTWLFTVMACAVDTDGVGTEAVHVSQSMSLGDSGVPHHHDGGSQDDPCCQWQSSTVISFNAVKLPQATVLMAILPVVLLLMLSRPSTPIRVATAPDRYAVRRRFQFLVHSLQAQAPPR